MTYIEVDALLTNRFNQYKDNWEKVRQLSYIIAQVNSSKELKPKDVLKFDWDSESDLSAEELQAIRANIPNLIEQLKENQ